MIMILGYFSSVFIYSKVPDSSDLDSWLKLLNSDVKVMDMLKEYDGLPVIVLYEEKGEDPIQVVTRDGCLVAGPRLRLTYGEKGDVEQGSSDRVGNEEYGGSDRVRNEENYGTGRVVNEDKNIEINDDDDDILDYCENEDLEVNEEGTISQQNKQGDYGEDEVQWGCGEDKVQDWWSDTGKNDELKSPTPSSDDDESFHYPKFNENVYMRKPNLRLRMKFTNAQVFRKV
ncbi:hypothetical protein F0562_003533 [Nyssa sinensis]|uniref:Uncharacterized protein n=1 Tax=Nyssa sinensis TaxID=561372 RepID=A0A5J5BWS4_9ASTE|nr:hypothetical protein F0562_003533 [Nyssa sinensis]